MAASRLDGGGAVERARKYLDRPSRQRLVTTRISPTFRTAGRDSSGRATARALAIAGRNHRRKDGDQPSYRSWFRMVGLPSPLILERLAAYKDVRSISRFPSPQSVLPSLFPLHQTSMTLKAASCGSCSSHSHSNCFEWSFRYRSL